MNYLRKCFKENVHQKDARTHTYTHTHTHIEGHLKEIISLGVAAISIQEIQTVFNYMFKKFQA
jgi:hypothetical protein